ncbi:lysine--tRNA ligase [bacterium]|nr:lysine--tRNA ligase [bacterium]
MAEADIRADRLKKLDILKSSGMSAFPVETDRTIDVAGFVQHFEESEKKGDTHILAGRVMSRRGQGGIMFADLFDGSARTQVVLQKAEMDEQLFTLFADTVDAGDFVEITGKAYLTKRGEKSILVQKWKMLAKSLSPLPSEWYGVKDEELKLRERYLDILMNEEVREMFVRRSKFWQSIRNFYLSRGFMEVETPILETMPGGADARPFVSHHNALDMEVYLRISTGELWQKRLLAAGFPKVFEIGRIFRNEGQSREHLQDYTQLESYEAYNDMRGGMTFILDLYRTVVKEVYGKYTFEIGDHAVDFADEWKVIDFCTVIEERYGINPLTCSDKEAIQAARDAKVLTDSDDNKARAVDSLWKSTRKRIAGPAFLVGIPVYLEPLAKRSEENPLVVERFQVLIAGSEVGKGFSELNDPIDQRERFEAQQAMRDAGDDEAQRLDEEYIRAMEYGMPPAFGFGVSERLFAFLENRSVHECQLFPLLRPRQ